MRHAVRPGPDGTRRIRDGPHTDTQHTTRSHTLSSLYVCTSLPARKSHSMERCSRPRPTTSSNSHARHATPSNHQPPSPLWGHERYGQSATYARLGTCLHVPPLGRVYSASWKRAKVWNWRRAARWICFDCWPQLPERGHVAMPAMANFFASGGPGVKSDQV